MKPRPWSVEVVVAASVFQVLLGIIQLIITTSAIDWVATESGIGIGIQVSILVFSFLTTTAILLIPIPLLRRGSWWALVVVILIEVWQLSIAITFPGLIAYTSAVVGLGAVVFALTPASRAFFKRATFQRAASKGDMKAFEKRLPRIR